MARHIRLVPLLATVLAAAALPTTALAAPPPERVRSYVVVLTSAAGAPRAEAARLSSRYGGEVGHVYEHALRGFVLTAAPSAAAALENNPRVDFVEAVAPVTATDQTSPTGVRRTFASGNPKVGIDKSDDARVDADVAVLDTGVDLDHPDLNVAGHVRCLNVTSHTSCSGSGDDDHGHGTHVAGSAAALDNATGVVGMAPGARLWAVKVLDSRGSGSNAGVAAGLDWVLAHNAKTGDSTGDIEVANLSLGGSASTVMDDAVTRAVERGVTVAVAAGNDGKDAGSYSPARAPAAITVSALADFNGLAGGGARYTCYPDVDDTQADFSNYGNVIDIMAPGVCISSTTRGGGYGTKSGTSMASPHVAGAAALLRSMGKTHATTEQQLLSKGNLSWSGDKGGPQEPLLDVSDEAVFAPALVSTSGPTDPTDPSPDLTFTGSSTGAKSTWKATITVSNATSEADYAGTWMPGGTSGYCRTASGATTCSFSLSGISKKTTSVTWTYSGDGTSVRVTKP